MQIIKKVQKMHILQRKQNMQKKINIRRMQTMQ